MQQQVNRFVLPFSHHQTRNFEEEEDEEEEEKEQEH